MSGGVKPSKTVPFRPAGATPIEIARAAPTANPVRLTGDPILHPDELVGDRYRVDALLGRGGFGDVYRAVHIGTHERVALKVLRPELLADATAVERFTHEARMSAGLRHPNTVRVFDFGRINDGPLYLAMEFLEGDSLETILVRDGPMEPQRTAKILIQVLKSLAEAHGRKIVHRDLKPENIFVGTMAGEDDFVHVIDFGIAKFVAEGQSPVLTQAGAILGTPHYMSPEQLRGYSLDGRADLYSAGVVLFRCLTGDHPFTGDSTFGILAAHLQDELPKIAMPGVDSELQGIASTALAREREARFATADTFRQALEQWLAKHPKKIQSATAGDDKTQVSDVLSAEMLRDAAGRSAPADSATVVAPMPTAPPPLPDTDRLAVSHPPAAVDTDAVQTIADQPHPDIMAAAARIMAQHAAPPEPQPQPQPPPVPSPAIAGSTDRPKGHPHRPPSKAAMPRPAVAAPVLADDNEERRTVSMDVLVMPAPAQAHPPSAPAVASHAAPPAAAADSGRHPSAPSPGRVGAAIAAVVAFGAALAVGLWVWSRPPAESAASPKMVQPASAAAAPAAPMAVPPAVAPNAPDAVMASAHPQPAADVAPPPPDAAEAPAAEVAPAAAPAPPDAPAAAPAQAAVPGAAKKDADKPHAEKTAKPEPHGDKPVEADHKAPKAEKPVKTGGCAAAEGSAAWCTGCAAAANLGPSSKHFCSCLAATGQTAGLTYYCKCVFPKETHKIGSPPFCRCNPRDPACE